MLTPRWRRTFKRTLNTSLIPKKFLRPRSLYAAEVLRCGKFERKSQCIALEEYWERGRGPGEVRLPLEALVRMTAGGCEDASLIRKTSGNG